MSEIKPQGRWRLLVRMVRIVTGLVLLAFVTTHLLNASLGIISIEAMENAKPYLTGFWGDTPLGLLLTISLTVHFGLGLLAIFLRPTLRTNAQDIVQLFSSVCVVPLMATHALGVIMLDRAGVELSYAMIIQTMWVSSPSVGLMQVLLVSVIWIHGCAGLLTWLRSMPGARTIVLWIYPIAVAIPILALLGFSEAGRAVLTPAAPAPVAETGYGSDGGGYSYGSTAEAEPDAGGYGSSYQTEPDTGGYGYASDDEAEPAKPRPAPDFAFIMRSINQLIWGSIILTLITFAARWLRLFLRPHATLTVIRDGKAMAPARAGLSVLDIFSQNNQPHARLCEGRGRCGTCAVALHSSEFPLPEPGLLEQRTLNAKGLPEGARLACQLCPEGGHVDVTALYPATYSFLDDMDPEETTPAEDPAPETPTDPGSEAPA